MSCSMCNWDLETKYHDDNGDYCKYCWWWHVKDGGNYKGVPEYMKRIIPL
jgi:hypothetical protein